jgi:hypothetical protein
LIDSLLWFRSEEQFLQIFADANLQLINSAQQTAWPSALFRVKMFAIAPLDTAQ